MKLAVGVLLLAIGCFAFAAALIPRWQGMIHWKGTRVPVGRVGNLGFGLTFAAASLLFLTQDAIPAAAFVLILLLLFAGIIMIFVAQWLDFRR